MTEELKSEQIHAGREVCYATLSRLFLEPPCAETYETLEVIIPKLSFMTESENVNVKDGLTALNKFINNRSKMNKKELAEYDLDTLRFYTRIFCLTDSVPISESYYTSVEKLVMQESRDRVMKIYNETGLSIELDSNEPEDHLSFELLFMSYMAMLTKNAIQKGNKERFEMALTIQSNFLTNHLNVWLGSFLEKVSFYKESADYYLPLTMFMVGYVKEDSEYLDQK